MATELCRADVYHHAGAESQYSLLGVVAAAYKLLLYRFVSNHAEYEVAGISPGAGAVYMQLAPVGKAIDFEPGQFGFLRMKE